MVQTEENQRIVQSDSFSKKAPAIVSINDDEDTIELKEIHAPTDNVRSSYILFI